MIVPLALKRFSEKLASLNDTLQQLLSEKDTMESNLRLKYGAFSSLSHAFIVLLRILFVDAQSLTLRSAPGQGMFIHLARAKRDKKQLDLDPNFYTIGESLSTKSYIYRVSISFRLVLLSFMFVKRIGPS